MKIIYVIVTLKLSLLIHSGTKNTNRRIQAFLAVQYECGSPFWVRCTAGVSEVFAVSIFKAVPYEYCCPLSEVLI
jgi:hypothetical protein